MTALNLTAHEATYGATWLAQQQQQQQQQQPQPQQPPAPQPQPQQQPGLSRTPVAAGAAGLLPLLHALNTLPSPLAAAVLPHVTSTAAVGPRSPRARDRSLRA
jgi:hypothetical protein